ncbi:MAG: cyclic nucleotide-binding domain-containing protein [Planctomycetota bacterium]
MFAESNRFLSADNALLFLYAANILYVVCYTVKDVLWLRIFSVVAILVFMPYYIWGTETTQIDCIFWNMLFLSINAFWIFVIIQQRRPPRMSESEKRLFEDVFHQSCSEREMLELLSAAKQCSYDADATIVSRGSEPEELILIDRGTASVLIDRQLVASLERGDFVAEMSYLTGEPAVADVVAHTSMKIIRWSKSELENLFERRPSLKSSIHEIIGRDLVQKIVSAEPKVPELTVDTVVSE